MTDQTTTPPRDSLVRAVAPGCELRAADDGQGSMPTLHGHFAVFNEWTEIHSEWEGDFLERILPGAFQKTFSESRDGMRVLFQHGHDPQIGDKPLGPITDLREDDTGAYYEVPLLDTSYNRDLVPALEADQYGASFRFSVVREEFDKDPERSEHNPDGIAERSIKEARVMEFGPVTFPAYSGATAGVRSVLVRSLTDDYGGHEMASPAFACANRLSTVDDDLRDLIFAHLADPERLRSLLDDAERKTAAPRPAPGTAPTPASRAAHHIPPYPQEAPEWRL